MLCLTPSSFLRGPAMQLWGVGLCPNPQLLGPFPWTFQQGRRESWLSARGWAVSLQAVELALVQGGTSMAGHPRDCGDSTAGLLAGPVPCSACDWEAAALGLGWTERAASPAEPQQVLPKASAISVMSEGPSWPLPARGAWRCLGSNASQDE